ncbi:AAA family ATPase [Bacillus cereus]|uniref:AAA family ATPase n=1 Tax=Bacillus cereus TaxID=1396 RepID=UPI0010BF1FD8|nr:SMC family ATPase [Bacillus cereus]MBR9663156.1 hypothetical protein [Bacillus cereus]MCT6901787.1 SMC family ATPase [Lactobacillus sp.]TKH69253.1 SMC family ATPase [Bacillus cereus]
MQLQKLIIENFRVFSKSNEFDFTNKSVIILDGPNGHGKSSFFDAIQWCFTGEIQRYKGSNEHQNFNYIINNEAYQNPPINTKVEVWLKIENTTDLVKISRVVRKTKKRISTKIFINNEEFTLREGREKIKDILVNKQWIEGTNKTLGNIEDIDFARFFSTSQLLSQDQLRAFIQNTNPRERFRVLENLLGLKKYGVHFNSYLNELNETLKEKLIETENILRNIKNDHLQINTKLQTKVELMNNVGNLSETHILQNINNLMQNADMQLFILHPINEINLESQSVLIQARKEINLTKNQCNSNILTLKNALTDLKALPTNLESKKRDLENRLFQLKHKQINRASGLKRCKVKVDDLNVVKQKQDEYYSLTQKINSLLKMKDELQLKNKQILNHTLLLNLKKENIDYIDLNSKYNQNKLYQSQLLTLQRIKEDEEVLVKLTNQLEEHEIQKQELEDKILFTKKEIFKLDEILHKITKERESHISDRINQLVYEVQQYLLDISLQKNCIVCGNDFENTEVLHQNLRQQIDKAEMLRSNIDQKYIKYSTEKKILEDELLKINNNSKNILNKITDTQIKINELSTHIEKLKLPILDSSILDFSKEKLLKELEITEMFLNKYRITNSLIETLQKNLEKENSLSANISNYNNKLQGTLLNLGKYAKYFNKDLDKLQSKINFLQNYELKASQYLNNLNQEIKNIEEELQQIRYDMNLQQDKIKQLRQLISNFNGDLQILEQNIKNYEQHSATLSIFEQSLQSILQEIQVFLSQEELLTLRKKENALQKDLNAYEKNKELCQKLIYDIEESKKKHTTVQSNLMTTYLSGYSDLIDQLFIQISPHAIYKHVHLVPKDGNLYIIMSEKNSTAENLSELSNTELEARFNASLTFSSGQASVLAVCIFLALNQGQNWTKLKFLGIDDPFQNMDDVNTFSFIDVLSQLSLERQIFISTHSKEFTALMRAKVGVSEDQIGYINFQSYSSSSIDFETNCSL